MPPSSWAKKTGFRPKFSGETNASYSGQLALPPRPTPPAPNTDLEAGRARAPANGVVAQADKVPAVPVPPKDQPVKKRRDSDGGAKGSVPSTNGQAPPPATAAPPVDPPPQTRRTARHEEVVDVEDDGFVSRHSHMKYELRDSPGLGKIFAFNLFVEFLGVVTFSIRVENLIYVLLMLMMMMILFYFWLVC